MTHHPVVAPHYITVGQAVANAAQGKPWPISGDHTTRARQDSPDSD